MSSVRNESYRLLPRQSACRVGQLNMLKKESREYYGIKYLIDDLFWHEVEAVSRANSLRARGYPARVRSFANRGMPTLWEVWKGKKKNDR
jgi:hypothetical protein